jgi:diaminohydroxyphosphoribosylaminopyrimidine deaminase/5-amino-6-(5-phosphoribosylamino)uracil reductase
MNMHTIFMARCIELARLGAGQVAPNPMVGSVLVFREKIIGEGYHKLYGQAHAEVNCIHDAECHHPDSSILRSSTLYVSLEPCAHYGKTPPCADLIIAKQIPKVVIGCRDPFEEVNGRGIEKLKAAGIDVVTGVLEDECNLLNKRFFTFHTKKRPYITLKWAESADGKIGGHTERVLISNEVTNRKSHQWRSEEAAILVGTNTALADDPSLTTRYWTGNNPVRLVIDMNLRLPATLKLFDESVKTIVFNGSRHEQSGNIKYYRLQNNLPLAGQVSKALYELNIQSVLVEGGSTLLQAFVDEGLWDEARVIRNGTLRLGMGVNSPLLSNAELFDRLTIYDDTISFLKPAKPA